MSSNDKDMKTMDREIGKRHDTPGRSVVVGSVALIALACAFGVGRARAEGIPPTGALTYSGTLEDANGAVLTGTKQIVVALYDSQTNGALQCTVTQSIALVNGRFQVLLPDACTQAVQAKANLWVEVTVDGTSLGRVKLGAVPYAAEAQHSVAATNAANATNATNAANATNSTNAANATGNLATQINSLSARIATLENKPQPLTRLDNLNASNGDAYFTECLNQTGIFYQGACARMAHIKCRSAGYVSGYLEGDILNGQVGIYCIK